MLTAVEVHVQSGGVPKLSLPLIGDVSGAFHIRDIEGLGPVKAIVNSRGYGLLDGEYYTGSHIGKRNIVLTIGLNPNAGYQSVEAMRKVIYGYLRPKTEPLLKFVSTDRPLVEIAGYVESCEPVFFSKDPEIQVSIICPKPYFISSELKSITGVAGISPSVIPFIFNCDLTNGIVFKLFKNGQDYEGPITLVSADHRPNVFRVFKVSKVLVNSKSYYSINSHQGLKTVESRNQATNLRISNLLGKVTDESLWPYVVPGFNAVRVITNSNSELTWILYYVERFGGI